MTTAQLAELTWNKAYPDRRPWDKLGESAQAEWVRIFLIYEEFIGTTISQAKKEV